MEAKFEPSDKRIKKKTTGIIRDETFFYNVGIHNFWPQMKKFWKSWK